MTAFINVVFDSNLILLQCRISSNINISNNISYYLLFYFKNVFKSCFPNIADFFVCLESSNKVIENMTVLPPAPNWFSAQILNSTSKGYVAYGAKNSIVVLKCKPQSHFCDIPNEEKNINGKHHFYRYDTTNLDFLQPLW